MDSEMVTSRVSDMFEAGMGLERVVELLNAGDFLEESGRETDKHSAALVFNVQAYVRDLLSKGVDILLPKRVVPLDETILPPGESRFNFGSGSGFFDKMKYIPRTFYMMQVLSDLGFEYEVFDGKNTEEMFRDLSYKIFVIPSIEKIAFVCNEQWNASFVIHRAGRQDVDDYRVLTKDQLRAIAHAGGLITPIKYLGKEDWEERMKETLLDQNLSEDELPYEERLAPVGWTTIGAFMFVVSASHKTVEKLLEPFKLSHVDHFRKYKSRKVGRSGIHFSPEVAELLELEFAKYPLPPEEWLSVTDLMKQLNVGSVEAKGEEAVILGHVSL